MSSKIKIWSKISRRLLFHFHGQPSIDYEMIKFVRNHSQKLFIFQNSIHVWNPPFLCILQEYSPLSTDFVKEILKCSKNFINTKKAFKKLYMFYFETFRIILNPSSVKKISLRRSYNIHINLNLRRYNKHMYKSEADINLRRKNKSEAGRISFLTEDGLRIIRNISK